MTQRLSLVVLAAGVGSRYGGLKQMDPMGPGGELIIDYSVYDALRAGVDRIVFVISKAIEEAFRERIGRTIEKQCDTAYVFQRLDDVPAGFQVPEGRKKPWGTAHAVLTSRSAVDGPFMAINADDFYGRAAYRIVAEYLRSTADAARLPSYCMVGYRLGNTLTEHGYVARGLCTVDADRFLVNAVEHTRIEKYGTGVRTLTDGEQWQPLPLDAIVSMNFWGFTQQVYGDIAERFPRFLAANSATIEKAELYIPNVVADLIREHRARVKVLTSTDTWHGVTYAQDKAAVRTALQVLVDAGVYPARLWSTAA